MVVDNGDGGTKTLRFCFGPELPEGAMELTYENGQWPWADKKSNITKVEFDNLFRHARPESCKKWFYGFTKLKVIKGIENLNTSEVTDMGSMFDGCIALTSLNLSSFNTAKVENMGCMFRDCEALTSLDLSSFNTASVQGMFKMFMGCSSLTSLDLSSFNTAEVTDMSDMFKGCSALTSLDLSSFNTAEVDYMDGMFQDCNKLTTILVDNLWKIKDGASGDNMFEDCKSLVGGNRTKYDGRFTGIQYARIDGSDDEDGYLTSIGQCEPYAMVVGNGKTLRFCFGPEVPEGAMELKCTPDFENPILIWTWSSNKDDITKVEFDNLFRHARPEMCTDWFNGFTKLTEIKGIENLNTSEVTDMSRMFYGCEKLTSLDLSSFNTEGVIDMYGMFSGCESLTSLDLSSFNTASVQLMDGMFNECESLTTILVDRNLWKIKDGASGGYMFYGCTNLVGGNGTKCDGDENNINETYAIVDGNGGEGYLTHNALKLTKSDGTTTAEIQGDFEYSIGAALLLDKDIKVSKVTFKREFTQGVTATIMLPFSFTVDNNIHGTFHTLKSVAKGKNGEWTAELSGPITNIQANTPYIFYPKDDITSMEFTGDITLLHLTDDLTNGANDGWQLHGVYSKKIWTEDSKTEYGFAGEKVEEDGIEAGEFVRAGKGASADPMRCYLTYAGTVNPFTAKSSVVLPDRIRVVFPQDPDDDITPATNPDDDITPSTDPDEVITPVSSISETSDIKVWSFGGTVFIEAQPDMDYTIVDLTGRVIKKGATHSTREEVSLNAKGIVIVKIANKSFKIK